MGEVCGQGQSLPDVLPWAAAILLQRIIHILLHLQSSCCRRDHATNCYFRTCGLLVEHVTTCHVREYCMTTGPSRHSLCTPVLPIDVSCALVFRTIKHPHISSQDDRLCLLWSSAIKRGSCCICAAPPPFRVGHLKWHSTGSWTLKCQMTLRVAKGCSFVQTSLM